MQVLFTSVDEVLNVKYNGKKRQGGARMPFGIARNNIIHMQVDAIINSANPKPVVGLGTDSGIHEKAGPELLEARRGIDPIPVGRAAITPAFQLNAKYVIHTVARCGTAAAMGKKLCFAAAMTALWSWHWNWTLQ